MTMQLIEPELIQQRLNELQDQNLYIHLEMTTGAYASHMDSTKHPSATFISNALIRYTTASISEKAPFFRVGLKTETGWVYSEGLTHYEESDQERLILAGHDAQGKLVVALQLSREPF